MVAENLRGCRMVRYKKAGGITTDTVQMSNFQVQREEPMSKEGSRCGY